MVKRWPVVGAVVLLKVNIWTWTLPRAAQGAQTVVKPPSWATPSMQMTKTVAPGTTLPVIASTLATLSLVGSACIPTV